MKKILFLMLFILGVALPMTAFAEGEACPNDYYGFIFNHMVERERGAAFEDIFRASYCQVSDIIEINDEIDAVRESFRSAAYACENTVEFETDYLKLKMERYFVRNVMKSRADVMSEAEIEKEEDQIDETLELLQYEMNDYFVEELSWVSSETLDLYFAEWEDRYEDRIGGYFRCEEGAWAELTSTVQNFKDTIQDLSIDVEKKDFTLLDVDVEATADVDDLNKLVKTAEDIAQSVKSTWEFFKKFANSFKGDWTKEHGKKQTASEAVSDLGADATINDTLEALSDSEFLDELGEINAARLARYEILYGENGALAAYDLQQVVAQINTVVEATNIEDFPQIQISAAKVYDKQCN